jgi:hypothetical protein
MSDRSKVAKNDTQNCWIGARIMGEKGRRWGQSRIARLPSFLCQSDLVNLGRLTGIPIAVVLFSTALRYSLPKAIGRMGCVGPILK